MSVLIQVCALCGSEKGETLLELNCGNTDASTLYPTVRLRSCSQCGHLFNLLSSDERTGLTRYYDAEYAPANVGAKGLAGDRPGSQDIRTAGRYARLFDILGPHLRPEHEILDVGCAMGGFLQVLREKGYRRLSGVEMTDTYVEQARKTGLFRIEKGDAESLPFQDESIDVVIIEQVLEHLFDPSRAFREAERVLRKGGVFFVGVPDAARYADFEYFDYYWILLREHIQHFDTGHLRALGLKTGFEMVDSQQISHAVMGPAMVMPDVYTVFSKTSPNPSFSAPATELKRKTLQYIAQERRKQDKKTALFSNLAATRKPVYAWGIGREFLYLYESAGLKNCCIAGLIDRNPTKLSTLTINGIRLQEEEILREAGKDSVLVIAAVAHRESITAAVRSLGFKGEILDLG